MNRLVAFFPRHETSWFKMQPIINKIIKNKNLNYFIIINDKKISNLIKSEKKNYKTFNLTNDLEYKKSSLLFSFLKKADSYFEKKDFLSNFFLIGLFRAYLLKRKVIHEKKVFLNFFKEKKPFWLMLPGDRELPPVLTAIKAANNLKINSVIAVTVIPDPFCLHSDRNKYRKFRTSLKRFSPILNFWAGKMYPKQVFQHKNDSTLFSPGWRTLALGKTGMISQNPWIQGGGNSDFVFESDFEFIKISKKYKRTSKVVMTGDQSSDLLFKSLIKKKIKKNKKKTILFAVPNDAEHNLCSWKEHIIRIRKYAEILSKFKEQNIVISLHPKSKLSNYNFLIKEFNFKVNKKKTSEILPYCDVLIASASSTIFWGALCGIPVINIEGENDKNFNKFWNRKNININHGIYNIYSLKEFEKRCHKVLKKINKKKFLSLLKVQSQLLSKRLLFDGNASYRILKFLIKHQGAY